MNFVETLLNRSAEYPKNGFQSELQIIPSQRTLIVGCVDPRVDPHDVLKLKAGEAAIIRNVGGRVNPALLATLKILRTVSKVGGQEIGEGWNLILLQHTECGIKGCLHHATDQLATMMGVPVDKLDTLAIEDPYKAVALDVAALKANPDMPAGLTITGLVYDVKTGETIQVSRAQ